MVTYEKQTFIIYFLPLFILTSCYLHFSVYFKHFVELSTRIMLQIRMWDHIFQTFANKVT